MTVSKSTKRRCKFYIFFKDPRRLEVMDKSEYVQESTFYLTQSKSGDSEITLKPIYPLQR